MGNLLTSLLTVAESMRAIDRSISLVGNNVTNVGTPGYVRHDLPLVAKRFEIQGGLAGGVDTGPIHSAREKFLEENVRDLAQHHGRLAQQASNLERIEPIFDISTGAGIAGKLDALFQSFSQWSVNPNDTPGRQRVLDRARDLAAGFNTSMAALGNAEYDAKSEIGAIVTRINHLGELIHTYNHEARSDQRKRTDPGLGAQIHSALENLSEYVDIDVLEGNEGGLTVLIGGQTPLTIGENFYPISADTTTPVRILDASGADITHQIRQGRLRGVLDFLNTNLPSLQTGLNTLAQSVADRINAVLAGGVDRNGSVPAVDLFTYDAIAGAAATIDITAITTDELAGALPTAPGGNGNALTLADLATSPEIGSSTFAQFYGEVAGRAGRWMVNARQDERVQSLLLTQARTLRHEETGVNLDEEAAKLVAFQRQYEANAELVRILNELTDTMIGIIR